MREIYVKHGMLETVLGGLEASGYRNGALTPVSSRPWEWATVLGVGNAAA